MTTEQHDHETNCLMCAVRALTEGAPSATWAPEEAGATISGVVLRQGEVQAAFGPVPFVDLWTGGTGRVRLLAYQATFRHALANAAAQVGDRLQVWFDGKRPVEIPRGSGRTTMVRMFSVNVQRGH